MSAPVTETHVSLAIAVWNHVRQDRQHPSGAQLIADSEAKAVHLAAQKEYGGIADLAISLKAERDQLRSEMAMCKDASESMIEGLDTEIARLKARLYQGCDDERDMAISEGPAHGVCGLAEELTKRAEHAEAKLIEAQKACEAQREAAAREWFRAEKADGAIIREMNQRNEAVTERIQQQERAERAEAELDAIKRGYGELGRYEKLRLKYADAVAELAKERARLDAVVKNCWLVHKGNENMFAVFSHVCGDYITPWLETERAAIDEAMKEEAE